MERGLEEAIQQWSRRAGLPGNLVGLFDLPENLHVADDHRIEAAPDAQQMCHCVRPGTDVAVIAGSQWIVRPYFAHHGLELPIGGRDFRGRDIELGAVAGREHRGFADGAAGAERTEQRAGLLGSECQRLTIVETRGPMIHSEQKQGHSHPRQAPSRRVVGPREFP